MVLSLLSVHVYAAGLHYGEVFEQVALLQRRPEIPSDMPEDYAGEPAGLFTPPHLVWSPHTAHLAPCCLVACSRRHARTCFAFIRFHMLAWYYQAFLAQRARGQSYHDAASGLLAHLHLLFVLPRKAVAA